MLFVTKNNKRHFQYFEKVLDAEGRCGGFQAC